ncbi:MAG: hypothetical protein ACRDKW_06495 [Actinomycetota bacterium]
MTPDPPPAQPPGDRVPVAGGRAAALAATVREAAAGWMRELATLTPEQWRMRAVNAPDFVREEDEDENRPVGVIVHHLAVALGLHRDMARQIAGGEPTWMPTWDAPGLAEYNARHASENPDPDQAETLGLLAEASEALAAACARFTDAELDLTGPAYGRDMTTEAFVRKVAVGHGHWHLSSIRATVAGG